MRALHRVSRAAAAALVGAVLLVGGAAAAPAGERWEFYDEDGFYCEGNIEYPLAKLVCRNPRRFAEYRVSFFDFDERTGVVFVDSFASTPQPGIFDIRQQQMTFAEFRRRYGR
jgi:hypothetical protein